MFVTTCHHSTIILRLCAGVEGKASQQMDSAKRSRRPSARDHAATLVRFTQTSELQSNPASAATVARERAIDQYLLVSAPSPRPPFRARSVNPNCRISTLKNHSERYRDGLKRFRACILVRALLQACRSQCSRPLCPFSSSHVILLIDALLVLHIFMLKRERWVPSSPPTPIHVILLDRF